MTDILAGLSGSLVGLILGVVGAEAPSSQCRS